MLALQNPYQGRKEEIMACMCGDTHCSSCGPAQGNWRCVICRAWADDCCEHIDEETGKYKAEFQATADEANKAEADAWAAEMQGDYEPATCKHCGKELEDFSDIGCGYCDQRHPEWGLLP